MQDAKQPPVGGEPSRPPGDAGEDRRSSDLPAERRKRIEQYERWSLKRRDPLAANLGAVSAGLMRIAAGLEEALLEAMCAAPLRPERIQQLAPTLDFHYRCARLIERFGSLARQERKPRAR
jgi:hypothetical protein